MRWLIDEMLPPATATELTRLGHDALSVITADLAETDDAAVYAAAVDQDRVMVTGNFNDFAAVVEHRLAADQPCIALVFVRKRDFPRGRALAVHLARRLHQWATENPDPYPGPHWP